MSVEAAGAEFVLNLTSKTGAILLAVWLRRCDRTHSLARGGRRYAAKTNAMNAISARTPRRVLLVFMLRFSNGMFRCSARSESRHCQPVGG